MFEFEKGDNVNVMNIFHPIEREYQWTIGYPINLFYVDWICCFSSSGFAIMAIS